jgi:hypothetical protein
VTVSVALARLKGTWYQTGVAGGLLGTLEAADLGENFNRGERYDRTDTRNRFQSFHRIAPLARAITETEVERANPLGGLTPYGIVMAHVLLELFGDEIAREQALPVRVGAQAATRPLFRPTPRSNRFTALTSAVWIRMKWRRRDKVVRRSLIAGLGT